MGKIFWMSGVLLAVTSLSAQAGMERLSYEDMADVSGQGYVLTVGARSLSAPFAYDLVSSAAPAIVTNSLAGAVGILAPNFPTRISGARNMAVGITNTVVGGAVGRLQMLPFVGGLVPLVSITTN
ncbi:MAG: hypothetical protein WBB04_05690 [Candidatus Macondimonas sp.]